MCLFVTVSPANESHSPSRFKRLLKAASLLSVYSDDEGGQPVFHLSTSAHCACDLRVAGPDALGGGIELDAGACEALVKVAQALEDAGALPVEFRVFWAEQQVRERVELSSPEFQSVVAENSFHGNVSYFVVPNE